jgi:hypothetical protein
VSVTLSSFKENWNVLTNFNKMAQHQTSAELVHWFLSCHGQAKDAFFVFSLQMRQKLTAVKFYHTARVGGGVVPVII